MSISFIALRQNGADFDFVAVPEQKELSLSSANGLDLLDALGIDEFCSSTPWPIECFRALVTVARRKRLGHRSPAIPMTEDREPGHCTIIHGARAEGYLEKRLEDLGDLLNLGLTAGATHIGWG